MKLKVTLKKPKKANNKALIEEPSNVIVLKNVEKFAKTYAAKFREYSEKDE